jgi:NAD-dependent deacetylase
MASIYEEVAALMADLKHCVALTGAGISAESGIPTFRSKGGLWEKYDPMIYASIETFRQDPSKYWIIRGEFIRNYGTYQPNKSPPCAGRTRKYGDRAARDYPEY